MTVLEAPNEIGQVPETRLARLQFVTKVPPYNVGEIAAFQLDKDTGGLRRTEQILVDQKRALRLPEDALVRDKNLAPVAPVDKNVKLAPAKK